MASPLKVNYLPDDIIFKRTIFREQTGSSPVEHHIRLQVQAACHYLDAMALSIKEVAAELGYDDPYYFSRIFQKTLGCSPLAYRRSVKG